MQSPPAADEPVSLLSPVGYLNNSCGYCHSPTGSRSYYARSSSLSTEHYQSLVDRGWRRSGTLLYKPHLRRSCCPHYTIRLDAAQLKPTKDQRQALNRWNRHVLGEKYGSEVARRYPKSKAEKARSKTEFDLIDTVHGSEYSRLKMPPEPDHKCEVTLEPNTFTEEKYALFSDYQQKVHKEAPEEVSRQGFRRFLCTSPLKHQLRKVGEREQKLGSYHQCYRLDGRLVAIGVLDLLPHCVSAVYFIYHEDVNCWNFGKIGALREAALAVEGGYQYYYMGFYIHSCVKMRYKGDYHPQYILDPESYAWYPLDGEFRQTLDARKYVSLSGEGGKDQDAEGTDQSPKNLASSGHSEQRAGWKRPLDEEEGLSQTESPDEDEDEPGGTSLFSADMPGIPTVSEVIQAVNLDEIEVKVGKQFAKTKHLVSWVEGEQHIDDLSSLKGRIAELAAAVGPQVAKEMVLSF